MPISVVNILQQFKSADSIGGYSEEFQSSTKPFLFCLKITGLHHLCWPAQEGRKFGRQLSVFYRGFVPALLFTNFVFSLGEFTTVHEFDGALLNSLISSVWFLQVTFFSMNNVMRCWRWERFYKNWNDYIEAYKIDCTVNTRKMAILAVCSYFVWLIVASAFMVVSIGTRKPPSGFMVYIPDGFAPLILAILIVAYFFFVSTWFLLTSHFAVICVALCRLFENMYQTIKRCFENRETFTEKVERFRQQHDKICIMIFLADDILSMFIMVTVATTIPLIVLTLYFVIFVTDDVHTFSYVATWWSITLSTVQLAIVFLFGGAVNYKVNASNYYRLIMCLIRLY